MKNQKKFRNVKCKARAFQKRSQNVSTTSRSNFMTPDVQVVKGQNRQKRPKNAIFAQNHKIAENDEHAQNVRRVVEKRPERFWKAYGPYF